MIGNESLWQAVISRKCTIVEDTRYIVKVAETGAEVESALRLRYEVFSVELTGQKPDADPSRLEFDEYDFKCRHLLVIDRETKRTVGTYRLNSIETACSLRGFYSYGEFTIEHLPADVLNHGVEIGRACIAPEHRNTKVLFLLWKGLVAYLQTEGKRYFFGCCSIFTLDPAVGERAYKHLAAGKHIHASYSVAPRRNALTFAGLALD